MTYIYGCSFFKTGVNSSWLWKLFYIHLEKYTEIRALSKKINICVNQSDWLSYFAGLTDEGVLLWHTLYLSNTQLYIYIVFKRHAEICKCLIKPIKIYRRTSKFVSSCKRRGLKKSIHWLWSFWQGIKRSMATSQYINHINGTTLKRRAHDDKLANLLGRSMTTRFIPQFLSFIYFRLAKIELS